MSEKIRLDITLYNRRLTDSRERAKAEIMSGQVYVNGQKVMKAGFMVRESDKIELRGGLEFVSRGGYKLKKAIKSFNINLEDKICMDIGASTGGFTDCMLSNFAKKVYSIDVGYGQLAWKLRNDHRVINLERTNIRYLTEKEVPEHIDFAAIDVSFISLVLVLPTVFSLLKSDGTAVCLIKPQFEAGKEKVGKKGVVREKDTHIQVIKKIADFAVSLGFRVLGLDFSPIKGPEGNIEYLLYIVKDVFFCDNIDKFLDDSIIIDLVELSHNQLNGGAN